MSDIKTSTIGKVLPLQSNEIDTDQIIPARFMKNITFDGLGEFAFYDQRFDENGKAKLHPFNNAEQSKSSILLTNKNFGCGSSREHAPQALYRFGIRAIIAESFAEIFRGNCTTMGIPTVTINNNSVNKLMELCNKNPQLSIEINLESKLIISDSISLSLEIPESYRQALITGRWDSTSALLANKELIQKKYRSLPYLNQFEQNLIAPLIT